MTHGNMLFGGEIFKILSHHKLSTSLDVWTCDDSLLCVLLIGVVN